MAAATPSLPWLEPGEPFPEVESAWDRESVAPGLLAAGGALCVDSLRQAYSAGIFPWFSPGQPVLWWSPDPRMVLRAENFHLPQSLRKKIRSLLRRSRLAVHFDTDFAAVIQACAGASRAGQRGTWIVPEMVAAYQDLHRAGDAHSVETWIDGELVGGLYLVARGKAVFGESMFSRSSDASKIALAALIAFCRNHDIHLIDCQQHTRHLASMGAAEIPRSAFLAHVSAARTQPAPNWRFTPVYWNTLLQPTD